MIHRNRWVETKLAGNSPELGIVAHSVRRNFFDAGYRPIVLDDGPEELAGKWLAAVEK